MDNFELLFWEKGITDRHRLGNFHTHRFWQLEFIISGAPLLETKKGIGIKLQPNEIAIIPPGCRHRFNYFNKAKESWSFKFNFQASNERSPLVINNDIETTLARNSIMELANNDINLTESIIASGILFSIVKKHCLSPPEQTNKVPPLVTDIKILINQSESANVDVAYLAKKTGYSRDYLSTLFKKVSGIQLKKFIDEERSKLAKRYLLYSDLSIAEIAEKMAFPDQFTFSHFFKRLNKVSPAKFRETL